SHQVVKICLLLFLFEKLFPVHLLFPFLRVFPRKLLSERHLLRSDETAATPLCPARSRWSDTPDARSAAPSAERSAPLPAASSTAGSQRHSPLRQPAERTKTSAFSGHGAAPYA